MSWFARSPQTLFLSTAPTSAAAPLTGTVVIIIIMIMIIMIIIIIITIIIINIIIINKLEH